MMSSIYMRAINVLAVVVVIVWLIPVVWVAITSIKPTNVINAEVPTFYSFEPTGEHYVEIFDRFRMDRAIVNSLVTVGVSTLIVMILALPAAYAVARMGLMGGDTWALVILSLRFLPGVVVVLPYFKMATWFSLIDTQIVLIVVYVAFGLPFAVWILRGFLLDLPKEVEEAARLDGLSWLQIIFRLILPMAAPGIAVTAIFTFVFSWNEYLYALFLTYDSRDDDAGRAAEDHRPLQRAVGFAQRRRGDTAIADDRRRVPPPATHRARSRARRGEIGPP